MMARRIRFAAPARPGASVPPARGIVSAIVTASVFTLAGCGQSVPAEKAAYVGDWHGTGMDLYIEQNGSVAYKRYGHGASRSLELPLKAFRGDDFVVGVGPLTTTFLVSRPPHREGNTWKMTVDGVELSRSPD